MNAKEQYGRSLLEKKTVQQLQESLRKLERIGKGQGDMAKLVRKVIDEKRIISSVPKVEVENQHVWSKS